MPDTNTQKLNPLATLVVVVAIVLIVAGALWHGFTFRALERFWHDLLERPEGPMRLRFMLQPAMAAIAAIRDGLADVRSGSAPYFITVLRNPQERVGLLNEGLNATARIMVMGLVVDVVYQALVFKTFYPDQALIVALLLAFVPYLMIRGLVARVWRPRTPASPHRH